MKMKRILRAVAITFLVPAITNAQAVSDQVEIGAGYANQGYYSLTDGEIGQVAKADWDLAFEASGFGSGIRINGANNIKLWRYPNADNSEFGTSLDTNGLYMWPQLVDSDTSWSFGAFNQTRNFNNSLDLGWGNYNTITHAVTGDSLFIIELSNGDYKQMDIIQLMGGKFEFRYADLDGQNVIQDEIVKSDYANKNFGYYSILNEEALDLEPTTNDSWDLLFTSYITMLGPNMPYGVTGVLMNKNIEVAKAEGVNDQESYNDWNSETYSHLINTIGYDWKSFNMQAFQFELDEELVFFIKSTNNEVWKLYFTGFGGSANGLFEFNKELLSTASIEDEGENENLLSVYPNPNNGNNISIIYDVNILYSDIIITITDFTGKIAFQELHSNNGEFSELKLNNLNLNKGGYIVSLNFGEQVLRQKLIVQ
jgi:hypothetical protein